MPGPSTVSVIMPSYNSALTVVTSLQSVVLQTRAPLEVIVVDDASSDGTGEAVKAYQVSREQPVGTKVIWLPLTENGGPARARNRGIAEAGGEWLAFLDADDAWLPERLQTQLELAATHPDIALWCGKTEPLVEQDSAEVVSGDQEGDRRRIELEEFITENPVATSTVLVKKKVLEEVGGFDEQFRGPEDYDLWMRIVRNRPAMLIDRPLSRYRYVPGSLSMDDRTFLPQVLRVLDKAFGSGGALETYGEFRESAVSNQLWNASWMAFHRGDRAAAIRYWWRAWRMSRGSRRPIARAWLRLLARYALGRPQAAGDGTEEWKR